MAAKQEQPNLKRKPKLLVEELDKEEMIIRT
jgi:hypothetical protein